MRALFALALIFAAAPPALAAGMFLAPRGVRPLARAGAFVAGADDVNALSYNPAGLAFAHGSALLDAGLPFHRTQYRRKASGAPEDVYGEGLGLPSPTLGATQPLRLVPGLVLGAGVGADYPLMQNWPTALDDGSPAPQRYAIYDYRGTAIAKLGVGAAYAIGEHVAVGAAFELFTGTFASTVAISNCDGFACTQPENPDYDATIQMVAKNLAVPGAHVGIIVRPLDWLRLGLAWESGTTIEKEAELRVRLPTAAFYENAFVDPEAPRGTVRLRLPMQLRAGVEARPVAWARVEAAFVYEPWSVHDRIDVDASTVTVRNVTALGDYRMGKVSIERGFRDTFSVRLGGEASPLAGWPLVARAGIAYEPSAIPNDKLTAMTVDLDKLIVALGASYALGDFALEATWAHVFFATTRVEHGTILQQNPTRPPWEGRTATGEGDYAARADVVGLGARYAW